MKRRFKYISIGISAAAAVLLIVLAWLFWTSSGARFLLTSASWLSRADMSVGEVRGRLADEILLENLRVTWPRGAADIETIRLVWSPFLLLRGELAVSELVLSQGEVVLQEKKEKREKEPSAPPELAFPEVEGLAGRLGVHVDSLLLENWTIRREGEEPLVLNRLSGSFSWEDRVLDVAQLSAATPEAELSGEGKVDFAAPSLESEGRIALDRPEGEIDSLSWDIDLSSAAGPRHLAGPVGLAVRAGDEEWARFSADLDWTREAVEASGFELVRPGREGKLTGTGRIVSENEVLRFSLSAALTGLDLHPQTEFHTELSGDLELEGTGEAYLGRISLINKAEDWRGVRIASPFSGDAGSISISEIDGEWLDGSFRGDLVAGWKEGFSLEGNLHGENFDPKEFDPQWSGRINLIADWSLLRPEEGELQADLGLRLPDSVLRGRALNGRVDARIRGENVAISQLLLEGDGFEITADGRLRERIDFDVDIAKLSGLIPQGTGSLQAGGWFRWAESRPAGAVSMQGSDISAFGFGAGQLNANAEYTSEDEPAVLSVAGRTLSYGEYRLSEADLQVKGTLKDHILRAFAKGPDIGGQLKANGGYEERTWAGSLTDLDFREKRLGRWALVEPVTLNLSPDAVQSSSLRLSGDGKERVAAAVDLSLRPLRGTAEGEWNSFDLSRLGPWIEKIELSGRTSGNAHVEWLSGERMNLKGDANLSGTMNYRGMRFRVLRADSRIAWGGEGLDAALELQMEKKGRLSAGLNSPEPARMEIPSRGDARADWKNLDLAIFSPLLAEGSIAGESSGSVAGSWGADKRIQARGDLTGTGEVKYGDLDLDVRRTKAEFKWNQKGLLAEWEIGLGDNGSLSGRVSSPEPARLEVPSRGEGRAEWEKLDLALLSPFMPEDRITGASSGAVTGRWEADRRLALEGEIRLSGAWSRDEMKLAVEQARTEFLWNNEGLNADLNISLAENGGNLSGNLSSPGAGRLAVPDRGKLRASWENIDLALLRPWMPEGISLQGSLAGETQGEWMSENRLSIQGETRIRGGRIGWQGEEGAISADLDEALLSLNWRGRALEGNLNLALADYGRAEGSFRLPLPARFPTEINPGGALQAGLSARVRERGLLTALMPGLVQESRGALEMEIRAGGTWRNPDLSGRADLTDAAATLPTAGVHLKDIALQARLEGEEIRLVSFQVRSGPGRIEGSGVLQLDGWKPSRYKGRINGEEFRLVSLPELEILASPDLDLEGTADLLKVRGEVLLPELLVRGRGDRPPVSTSPDVVVVDAPESRETKIPLDLDIEVRVILGDRVLVKAEGIDARLDGDFQLDIEGPDEINAQGEIGVVQGSYSAYGVNLKITRGQILWPGGPVDRPTLDILALRKIGDVEAGVQVTGTPRAPVVKLYSEPNMPDTDVLAYIVLGHPVGQGGGDAGLLMAAAGALLSKGESAMLQDRMKRRLGLDVLEIEAGEGEAGGSQITLGKYLNPDLYISFGKSLFSEEQAVNLRYNISEKWQIESKVSEESAVDLYYKIEFE